MKIAENTITDSMMKAFGVKQKPVIGNVPNEISELILPIPKVKEDEVLVRIVSSTLHVDDIALAQGTALGRFLGPKEISAEIPYILGSSFSGIIAEKGKRVSQFEIGDEVIGIPHEKGEHGSWATYRSINVKYVKRKPKELSHNQMVAILLAGCVAYGMILISNVKKGNKCLVLGASGGIGSIVVQMLKAKGAIVIALCSTRNVEMVSKLGADSIIDYKKESFSEKLTSKNEKMDFVFDSVGGKKLEKESMQVLRKSGRFLTVCGPVQYIGSEKLSWPRTIGMFWYILHRTLISKLNGSRYQFSEKYPSAVIDEMIEFIIRYQINVPFDRVIPFEINDLRGALKDLAAHKASGRIVMEVTNYNKIPFSELTLK